jgi:hypothetical protein
MGLLQGFSGLNFQNNLIFNDDVSIIVSYLYTFVCDLDRDLILGLKTLTVEFNK